MTFTYDPSTVVEREFIILPEGYYQFECIDVTESISKSSNKEMVVINLKLFSSDGGKYVHKVYITESSLYHLKNFWDSVGEPEVFEKMSNDFKPLYFNGKCGILKTQHEISEKDGRKYRNSKVHYFIKKKDQEKIKELINNQSIIGFPDDDIPF